VQVGTTFPYTGSYSLLLDDSLNDAIYSTAAAILTVDLSGQSQVDLDFWWRKLGDEDHTSDGVFISADAARPGTRRYPSTSTRLVGDTRSLIWMKKRQPMALLSTTISRSCSSSTTTIRFPPTAMHR